jgi:hypothetical protein
VIFEVFLDWLVTIRGLSKDSRDVLNWNAPTSVGDIQSFLGLAGYYQRGLSKDS